MSYEARMSLEQQHDARGQEWRIHGRESFLLSFRAMSETFREKRVFVCVCHVSLDSVGENSDRAELNLMFSRAAVN